MGKLKVVFNKLSTFNFLLSTKAMAGEIEADYRDNYDNEEKQCWQCDSIEVCDGVAYCRELEMEISGNGTCDFFKSRE